MRSILYSILSVTSMWSRLSAAKGNQLLFNVAKAHSSLSQYCTRLSSHGAFRQLPSAPQNPEYEVKRKEQTPDSETAFRMQSLVPRGGANDENSTVSIQTSSSNPMFYRVYIAVGSNLGNRFENIASAFNMLCHSSFEEDEGSDAVVRLVKTSFLLETAPMYVTDQPSFLNGAVEIETTLPPFALLKRLKRIEEKLGRDFSGIRNGPRPVDLDIIMYLNKHVEEGYGDDELESHIVMNTPTLTIPHPRISEREFVLSPLCNMGCSTLLHPVLNETFKDLYQKLKDEEESVPQTENSSTPAVQSLPLPRDRMLHFKETVVMGILNVTPDSFSDGGKLDGSVNIAVKRALVMVEEGAGIIDIGGESTRPGAKEIAIEEELQRTVPVVKALRKISDVPISIDTRHSQVAQAAVKAGADIVNDVSGGTFDPDMLSTVAELGVPIILMHSRGTPETMQSMTDYGDDIVSQVAESLLSRSRDAERAGIPRWLQVLDPGIGFAKDLDGNLSLLKHQGKLMSLLGEDFPILLGTSRKGFIGKLTGESNPEERDFGSIASCIAALCSRESGLGCNILRVHNVKGTKQAVIVFDAIQTVK